MDKIDTGIAQRQHSAEMSQSPHVAVLLCTYHGERYLDYQLESLLNQDYTNFSVWLSDDSLDEETRRVFEQYRHVRPDVSLNVRLGPGKGSSANFLSLLSSEEIEAAYFALCDQDDVWKPDKITRSVRALSNVSSNQSGLYCSRVELIDERGGSIGCSPMFNKPPSFSNALVQSLAGGNTMLLNRRARDIVSSVGVRHVVVHDWWIYLLLSGVGGTIIYDPVPTLYYRQHTNNIIGGNQSIRARMKRLSKLLRREHQGWHDVNIQALRNCEEWLTSNNRRLLEQFEACRKGSFGYRLARIRQFPFVRQTVWGTLSLCLALILKRL